MKRRFKTFRDIPQGTIFQVVKEKNIKPSLHEPEKGKGLVFTEHAPPPGWYLKVSPTRSQRYSRNEFILLGFSDIVQVIAYPSEKAAMRLT
jgi:hypothetical protein